jgi:O-antigen/teichoic acid export membrane protein
MLVRLYAVAASAQVLQALLSAGALLLLARLLSPSELGVYLLLFSAATILGVAVAAGPHAAHLILAARSPALRPELNGQGAFIAASALVLVVLVCALGADGLASLTGGLIDGRYVWIAGLLVPALIYGGAAHATLTGSGLVHAAARMNVMQAALAFGAPVGAALAPDPLLGSVAGLAAGTGAWAAVAAGIMARHVGVRVPSDAGLWREVLRLGVPLHVGSAAYWLMQRLDLFILNAIAGSTVVGIYGMARVLGEKTSVLIAPLHLAVSWRVSGDWPEQSRELMLFLVRVLVLTGGVLLGVGLLAGEALLSAFAGPSYRQAGIPFAALMATGILLGAWSMVALYLASQLERPWLGAGLQVATAVLAAGLYLGLGSAFGAIGMGAAALIASTLLLGLGLAAAASHDPRPIVAADLLVGPNDVALIRDALRRRSPGRSTTETTGSPPPERSDPAN